MLFTWGMWSLIGSIVFSVQSRPLVYLRPPSEPEKNASFRSFNEAWFIHFVAFALFIS